jgi:hypothetical protein
MDRALLEKPFAAEQIRTRRGGFGEKPLAYVAGHEYVRRLNEALDAEWSFEVVEYRILDAEVVVLGRLIAGAVQKAAFGGSAITRNRETGEVVSLADDLKSAATDTASTPSRTTRRCSPGSPRPRCAASWRRATARAGSCAAC